ncbi:MAG: metallophosphoesterase [Pyrinomonadaceae bacterium]
METLVLWLFLLTVFGIYALAALTVVHLILRRAGRLSQPSRRWLWLQRIVFTLAGLGLLCFAYGYFVEPYWPEVAHVRIESAKLPQGTRPIRLVHISDLHSDPQPRLETRLPDIIAAEHPDLIVFTGDAINSPEGLPVFKQCLTRLAQIAPTYAVQGNWDAWNWLDLDRFAGTGARELKSEAVKLDVAGTSIWIAGMPVSGDWISGETPSARRQFDRTLGAIPPDAFSVFLYHYPDEIEPVAARKVDLYCAGHTHGGQVALPLYGALITLSRFGKKYEAGLYHVGQTWLYVNRGLGMEGGPVPRVRFCARPEVTVIEIAPAE